MNIVVVVHDIRSVHNVGSILRSCDGFGIEKVYLTGYTPYPEIANDQRLPHIRSRITRDIHKTALGAEATIEIEHQENCIDVLHELKAKGYSILALEQTSNSTPLQEYKPETDVVLILGREVEGIDPSIINLCDHTLEIPMCGAKESFNVSVSCGIALYALRTA